MKAKKIIGFAFVTLGVLLIAGCLALGLFNRAQSDQAGASASQVLSQLETAAAVQSTAAPAETVTETTEGTEPTDPEDPITLSSQFVEGHEYVGYLLFPSLDRKLPIMKIKYLEDLQISPCLEKGSPHTDDAVIVAHNYPSHFGPIRDWEGGEAVQFIDLEGNTIDYTVSLVETIQPTDVEKVMESEHDLVLYTCTPGGAKRVMIACDRTEA